MTTAIVNSAPDSASLLNSLRTAAITKQRNSTLDRLVQACDFLCASGKHFSLRELEGYCRNTFGKGPNAQTISNDQSLRAYVDARKAEMGVRKSLKSRSTLENDIENISDIALRSRMRILAEDYRLTKKRLRILTESLSKFKPPLSLELLLTKGTFALEITDCLQGVRADEEEALALERVISFLCDFKRIRRAGLDLDSGDLISRGLRETLIASKDISAIQTLLKKLAPERVE